MPNVLFFFIIDNNTEIYLLQVKAPAYYMGTGAPSTLPRGGSLMRAFSPAAPPAAADRASTLPGAGTTTPLILHLHFVRVLPQASSRNPHGIRSEMSFRLQPSGGDSVHLFKYFNPYPKNL